MRDLNDPEIEESESGPGISAASVTALAIILLAAVYLLYRYLAP